MKISLSLASFVLGLSTLSFAAPDATIQADDAPINTACATDAQTANCGGEVVGKGLLKCLHAYKKANSSFKFSSTCKSAMMQRHSDKVSGK